MIHEAPSPSRARRALRILRNALLALFGLLLAFALVLVIDGWRAFGHRPEGERLARMQRSRQWRDGQFVNPDPLVNDWKLMLKNGLHASEDVSPREKLESMRPDPAALATPPATGLRITWFGHSSSLVEIDGTRILFDPFWSERASPFSWLGPKRWYPPAIALRDLGPIDAVVISHDHYDHLDYETILQLKDQTKQFIVPLGIGAHLEYWGVPVKNIVELDWWERAYLPKLQVVSTPARHASGRTLFDRDRTLWSGWGLVGAQHRVWYSGDTGLFEQMKEIGATIGPFDVSMIEVGEYDPAWPDWHIGPEQAVKAHRWVRADLLLPVHWALLPLAYHGWTEPLERVRVEGRRFDVPILLPRPGESFEPEGKPRFSHWWPRLPWRSAVQAPIKSSGVD